MLLWTVLKCDTKFDHTMLLNINELHICDVRQNKLKTVVQSNVLREEIENFVVKVTKLYSYQLLDLGLTVVATS